MNNLIREIFQTSHEELFVTYCLGMRIVVLPFWFSILWCILANTFCTVWKLNTQTTFYGSKMLRRTVRSPTNVKIYLIRYCKFHQCKSKGLIVGRQHGKYKCRLMYLCSPSTYTLIFIRTIWFTQSTKVVLCVLTYNWSCGAVHALSHTN